MARTASVTTRMERSLRAALEAKAAAEGSTLAAVVRRALRDSLDADLGQAILPFGACQHPPNRRWQNRCIDCGSTVAAAPAA